MTGAVVGRTDSDRVHSDLSNSHRGINAGASEEVAAASPLPAPQDVLPWLDQAAIDFVSHCYRPTRHYIQLFKDAAAEIRKLRAASKPPTCVICKGRGWVSGQDQTGCWNEPCPDCGPPEVK